MDSSTSLAESSGLPAGESAPSQPGQTAPVAGSSSGDDSSPVSVDGLQIADRKIVYNASLDMAVGDVEKAVGDVQRVASSAGGFLSAANVRVEKDDEEERKVADITVQVPASAYQDVLGQLRGLATEIKTETAQSSDVTEEFADLTARERNLEATESRYVQLLAEAKNIGEILQVQDRINATRLEIERIQGRLNLLNHLSDLATISVHLEPPLAEAATPPTDNAWDPANVASNAWEALVNVLRALASGIIVVSIFALLVVPVVAVAALAWKRFGVQRSQT